MSGTTYKDYKENHAITTTRSRKLLLLYHKYVSHRTPSTSKLLHREVVRLVTPGTLLDPLKPDANYLMSIACGPDCSLGLAWLDLSTGEFHHGLSLLENLEEDLSRINPAEVGIVSCNTVNSNIYHNLSS